MTTIATDGRTMAADSRVTVGDRVVTDAASKLRRAKDGSAVGFCGDTSDLGRFVDWLDAGADPDAVCALGDDFQALVLTSDGVFHYDRDLCPVRADVPAGIGSGGAFAIGAMMAGASPFEAVKIAMRRDVYSGGHACEMARPPCRD